jgi:hypothetical protein
MTKMTCAIADKKNVLSGMMVMMLAPLNEKISGCADLCFQCVFHIESLRRGTTDRSEGSWDGTDRLCMQPFCVSLHGTRDGTVG